MQQWDCGSAQQNMSWGVYLQGPSLKQGNRKCKKPYRLISEVLTSWRLPMGWQGIGMNISIVTERRQKRRRVVMKILETG